MDVFIHDKYTLKALELVRQGKSFFITGKAGTGKTTLLKEIVKECRARGKNIAVSAPTGVAAKNAEGQTLHSLLGLKTIVFIPGKIRRWFRPMDDARVKVIKNLDILIIDEISMVRCDVMDMTNLTLQHYKGNKKPFGGVQVILFGDLFQLPPVVTEEDEELLYSHYEKNNPYFFSSDVISKNPFPVLELETVYRQPDENFVEILNHIREGVYLDSDRNEINKRHKAGYEPSRLESGVFLRTTKDDVRRHNNRKLREIPGEPEKLWAEKDDAFPKKLYPTDNPLRLKVGAKVMLLRNDNDGLKYVNGPQGVVKSIYEDYVRVLTDEGDLVTLEQSTWDLYRYVYNEETKAIEPVVYASFTQFPLKLAWAVTIHKSQGMTFSKVIVDAHDSFTAGQVYVALSRCRSLDGLILTSRITSDDIMVDPIVVEYMKSVERIVPDDIEQEAEKPKQELFLFADDGTTLTGVTSETCGEIEIPEGVEKVADDAFKDNTKITAAICPDSLREIGDHAFWGCKNLKMVKLNEGLGSIGVEAFISTDLESIDLPSTLSFLDWTPFECRMNVHPLNENFSSDINGVLFSADETSLVLYPRKAQEDSIEVPESVTCIEAYAFENCICKEIEIPEDINELQKQLFNGCKNLKTLTINSYSPKNIEIDKETFKGFEVENCILRVPFEALSEYKSDDRFKDFKSITAIEGSRCLIYDDTGTAVMGCNEEDCEDIEIPEGVTAILDKAFEGNENIQSVELPDTLEKIGCSAFAGCSKLTEINLNDGLVSIEYDAFKGTGLSEVKIPSTVEDIGFSAFSCDMIVESANPDYADNDGILFDFLETALIIYPENKTDESYCVPDDVEEIESWAFENAKLTSLTLPNSIKTLGRNILDGCEKLKTLYFCVEEPKDLNIDEDVFEGFDKSQCALFVPSGCKRKYVNRKLFKDFSSIEEMGNEREESYTEANNEPITGQFFTGLTSPIRSESKAFCYYRGKYRCYIVMNAEGFFLRLIDVGYYFLSGHVSQYRFGNIWVKNKKDRLSSYSVTYTADDENDTAFGHFIENHNGGILTYTDYKSKQTFKLDLNTGKKM